MKNKMKILLTVISFVFILAGLSLILYSPASQYVYTLKAEKVIIEYDDRLEIKQKDELEELYQLIVQYNKELYENKQINLNDPFSYEQMAFSLKQFGFQEDMIGYLSVPRMGINLPIYLGANKENLKRGAAHLTQTSIPVGGLNTNVVIAAHRSMKSAAMFRDIQKMKIGDEIAITNFWETLSYRVCQIKVIHPYDINEILIQDGRDMVTLITCHPYRSTYQRYVVFCERV